MPISTSRMSITMMEESQITTHIGDLCTPNQPVLCQEFFDEISDMFHKIKSCQREENECLRKVDKMDHMLEDATMAIAKGREAKATLKKRNDLLREKLEQRERRIEQAVQYWKDYGFEVKQLSSNDNPFVQYEFIYSKLPPKSSSRSVILKYQDKELQLVEPVPDDLIELSTSLTMKCVQQDGHVDWKLAMILIKKEMTKRGRTN